jgi:uncharacterized membrane protein YdbT with pleckstrin-like domain
MDETPIREIRPVVVPAQYMVQAPLIAAFLSFFPAMFTFVISKMISGGFRGEGAFSNALTVYVLVFIGLMVLLWFKYFQEPLRTSYTIFRNRVEFDEGLWNKQRRTVVFDQVIDVTLTEGVLQQTQAAGTITLVTQQLVSNQEGKLSNRTISLSNVPEPREVYDLVRSLALKKNSSSN